MNFINRYHKSPYNIIILTILFVFTSSCGSYTAGEFDYRSRKLEGFSRIIPQTKSISVILAYGGIQNVKQNTQENLDREREKHIIELAENYLTKKQYTVQQATFYNDTDILKKNYTKTIKNLYSRNLLRTFFSNMDNKKTARSTRKELGKTSIEYADEVGADLLLMIGFDGFIDKSYCTYIPLRFKPVFCYTNSADGTTIIGLVEGNTGRLIWTHKAHFGLVGTKFNIDHVIKKTLDDALSRMPHKNYSY